MRQGAVTVAAAPGGELTDRELEIARLVADGWKDPRICRALFLSPSTVLWHLQRIRLKTGTHTRAEIVEWVKSQQAATAAGGGESDGA